LAKEAESKQQKTGADIGFHPTKPSVGESGHDKRTGIPVSGPPSEKNDVIGLTEYPKGQKRDDSTGLSSGKGYDIPMKEMDENQVANREKFNNEQRQYMGAMTIRQLRQLLQSTLPQEVKSIEQGKGLQPERDVVKPEDNPQYEVEKTAILRELGISTVGVIDFDPAPEKAPEKPTQIGPVQHKVLKTQPKIEQWQEPETIGPAAPDAQSVIQSLGQKAEELKKLEVAYKAAKEKLAQSHETAIGKAKTDMNTTVELAFKIIGMTADKIVAFKNKIYASFERSQDVHPAATVTQIIERAKQTDQHLADQIQKLKDLIEGDTTGTFVERTLYEYPVSKEHEKRVTQATLIAVAEGFISLLQEAINGLLDVIGEIDDMSEAF
jgi:hypothetical protein